MKEIYLVGFDIARILSFEHVINVKITEILGCAPTVAYSHIWHSAGLTVAFCVQCSSVHTAASHALVSPVRTVAAE
jgi:hypothetical protein